MGTRIEVTNLTKKYPHATSESLKDLSLIINDGDRFGILGPNGAGKTTFISILCGILAQTNGTVSFFENNKLLSRNELKGKLGFVPQDYAFYEELSPIQNLNYFGSLYGITKNELSKRITDILHILGLSKVSHQKVHTFSGGMKRRINLAIGIIHKPLFLFLDEPTVGADVQSKHAMITYLKELNDMGTSIVYTSHHMSEAEDFCNRIAFINKGELVKCDSTAHLIQADGYNDLETLFISLTGAGYNDMYE